MKFKLYANNRLAHQEVEADFIPEVGSEIDLHLPNASGRCEVVKIEQSIEDYDQNNAKLEIKVYVSL